MPPRMYPESLAGIEVKSSAEKILFEAFQSQLGDDYVVLHSVAWIEIRHKGKKPSDGEIDFVILHPQLGVLLIEVKGGIIGRDQNNLWYSFRKDGSRVDIKNPFEQVKDNKYAFIKKIGSLPNWQYRLPTIGHAVAFPDGMIDDENFGVDIPKEIVLLHEHLGDVQSWLKNCLKFWAGEKFIPPGEIGVSIMQDLLKKSWYLREPRLGEEINFEHALIEKYTEEQFLLLDWLAGRPRAAVRGLAGSGKTILARKKAQQLAHEGFRTLLTCYNKNLADALAESIGDQARLKVRTFHSLCQEYAIRTGRVNRPDWNDQRSDFFESIMPESLLEAAASNKEDYKFDAIIVDEGQDFPDIWWAALELLLADPANGVFYIFFDDNQLVYNRKMKIPVQEAPFPLSTNCRNTKMIHEASLKFYKSDLKTRCKGPVGRELGLNNYGNPPFTLEARLTEILARLVYEQNVPASSIVILSDNRTNSYLLNDLQKAGAFQLVPRINNLPDEVQTTTIRLYKGLEKPVVVLVEPNPKDDGYVELMYVGMSRAQNHVELLVNTSVEGSISGNPQN